MDPDPQVYCDADWANDPNDRKSISGYVATMCGGAISWSSKKQSVMALLSTEAEYIAAAHAAQESSWLVAFLTEIGCPPHKSIPFFVDNQSTIKLIMNLLGLRPQHNQSLIEKRKVWRREMRQGRYYGVINNHKTKRDTNGTFQYIYYSP